MRLAAILGALFALMLVLAQRGQAAQLTDCWIYTWQEDGEGFADERWVRKPLSWCLPEGGLPSPTPTLVVIVPAPVTNTPTAIPTITRTPTVTRTAAPPTATHTRAATATTAPPPTPNSGAQVRVVPDQYASITAALTGIPVGSTIRLRAGTYAGPVTIQTAGVTVEPFGDGPVWIDGNCAPGGGWGVGISANDVTVRGLGIRNTGVYGILVRGPSDDVRPARATIENNTIQDWNCTDTYVFIAPGQFTGNPVGAQHYAGISVWYGGPGQKVIGNTITRRVNLPGSQRGYGNGIWFKSDDVRPSGGGHVITDNVITGGFDGIGGETEDHGRGSFDRDTIIARNTVYDCADDGIQSEGGNVNVTIADNDIRQCGIGIAFAPNLVGPLFIERNFVYSDREGVHANTLACMKVGNRGNGFAYLTENTCLIRGNHDGVGDGIKQTNSGLQGFVMRDNVIDVTRYVIEWSALPLPGSYLDDVCLYTTDPVRYINVGGRIPSLEAFRVAALNLGLDWEARAVQEPCGVEVP